MYLYSAAHFSIVFTFFFFFNDTATTEIYTLSLHDALPISKTDALDEEKWLNMLGTFVKDWFRYESHLNQSLTNVPSRSEERFSRNAETDLVCRLLLEKKKKSICPSHVFEHMRSLYHPKHEALYRY